MRTSGLAIVGPIKTVTIVLKTPNSNVVMSSLLLLVKNSTRTWHVVFVLVEICKLFTARNGVFILGN
jgi:hypothetical protein